MSSDVGALVLPLGMVFGGRLGYKVSVNVNQFQLSVSVMEVLSLPRFVARVCPDTRFSEVMVFFLGCDIHVAAQDHRFPRLSLHVCCVPL